MTYNAPSSGMSPPPARKELVYYIMSYYIVVYYEIIYNTTLNHMMLDCILYVMQYYMTL